MTPRRRQTQFRRFGRGGLPVGIFGVLCLATIGLPLYSDQSISTFDIYNTFQNFASLGLLALAVALSLIIGEFDLSTIGMYGLGGILAVKLGASIPVIGVLGAVAAGVVAGGLQGLLMARTRISSVPLTLGGYITLLGLSHIASGENTLLFQNFTAGPWLDSVIASFFSPRTLIVLGVFVTVGAVFRWTRIGRDVRAVGGDRRASRTAGVQTGAIIIGILACAGAFSALGGALFAYSTSAAKPDLGLAPFIFAVTAVLLGGVSLSGGRGSASGVFLGVLSLSLLQTLFALLATPSYVVDLVQGTLLLLVVFVDAPDLRRTVLVVRSHTRRRGLKDETALPARDVP